MTKYFFLFSFVSFLSAGQNYWQLKDNVNPDKAHKAFPALIEIDTTIIKDLKTVSVKYNYKPIQREGNKFYLPSMPFVNSTDLQISLNDKGKADLAKWQKPINKNTRTTKEFNLFHAKDFYKIEAKHDTLSFGENYQAFLEIDTTKVKDIKKLTVLFIELPLKPIKNKYKIDFLPCCPGANEYDITIIDKTIPKSDSIKFTHTVFVKIPKKN
jgi:hypothetical protein